MLNCDHLEVKLQKLILNFVVFVSLLYVAGALPDAINRSLIRVVATLAEAKWQKLALCLGREGHAIPQYKQKSDEDSIRVAMVIEDWFAECGPTAATVDNLVRACEKCGIHGDRIASAYEEEL